MEQQYRIIYSLAMFKELVKWGYFPLRTIPNPKKPDLQCWVFEDTNEFRQKLTELSNRN